MAPLYEFLGLSTGCRGAGDGSGAGGAAKGPWLFHSPYTTNCKDVALFDYLRDGVAMAGIRKQAACIPVSSNV